MRKLVTLTGLYGRIGRRFEISKRKITGVFTLYKTDKPVSDFINKQPVEVKTYPGGHFAKTTVLHHSLEQFERSFVRMLSDNMKYSVIGGCYEEYILYESKFDSYTVVNYYEGIKRQ